MTITHNYAAGAETVKGFAEGLEKGGGKVTKDLNLPFPNVEFQALLTEIAAQKPDAVYAFFAGAGLSSPRTTLAVVSIAVSEKLWP